MIFHEITDNNSAYFALEIYRMLNLELQTENYPDSLIKDTINHILNFKWDVRDQLSLIGKNTKNQSNGLFFLSDIFRSTPGNRFQLTFCTIQRLQECRAKNTTK